MCACGEGGEKWIFRVNMWVDRDKMVDVCVFSYNVLKIVLFFLVCCVLWVRIVIVRPLNIHCCVLCCILSLKDDEIKLFDTF